MAEERKTDAAKAEHRRRIYVGQRLPYIKQELAQLQKDRAKVREDLKDADDKKKALLRKQQSYIVTRLGILRDEQKSMVSERQAFQLKESRPAKGRG